MVSDRFQMGDVPGAPALISKRGDAAAIAREVEALTLLAGRPWVPALVAHGPGWMHTERLPGAPRRVAAVGVSEAQRLGALLRELHEARRAPRGGLWSWPAPVTTLRAYRAGRAEDTEVLLASHPDAGLARRALGRAGEDDDPPDPFRMLHGDLVGANLVWGPEGPALVDWEFWRMGDPAEDLAYLIEVNALGAPVVTGLLAGYALPGMSGRVGRWRALVAADAGAWYLREGLTGAGDRLLARARELAGP